MLDHVLDDALLAHLKAAPPLTDLNAYTGQDNAEHKLPALTVSGEVIAAPSEGYPKFFEKLGVKPAAKGGDVTKPGALEGEFDETRTREIRAMDVVLSKARIGT